MYLLRPVALVPGLHDKSQVTFLRSWTAGVDEPVFLQKKLVIHQPAVPDWLSPWKNDIIDSRLRAGYTVGYTVAHCFNINQ